MSKETLRALSPADLTDVAGGYPTTSDTGGSSATLTQTTCFKCPTEVAACG